MVSEAGDQVGEVLEEVRDEEGEDEGGDGLGGGEFDDCGCEGVDLDGVVDGAWGY